MNSKEASVFYGSPIGVKARPDVIIELTEQGPQGTHGEKGDKGDTGTVTPEMLDILDQAKASAAEAADSSTNATAQADQANKFKDGAYSYYQQADQVKADTQAIKDAATKDVANAAKSLVELAANSEKTINEVTTPALNEIRSSKAEADAAVDEVRQARDAAKISATEAQASAEQTAIDANSVADAYNKITTIETNVTTLADKTEAAEKSVDAMNKSVSDNYQASQALKSDIDAAKTALDDQSDKVSKALKDAQKAAKDAHNSAAEAATSNTKAINAQKVAEDAASATNNSAVEASNSAAEANNAANEAKNSETAAADCLSKAQTIADKVKALKPEFDEAIEKNNAINDQISASKSTIDSLLVSAQEKVDKATEAANNAASSETNASATAEQVAADKATVVDAATTVTNLLDQVNTTKDSVEGSLDKVNTAKDKVEERWNDFSTIYYGASSTEPTGDVKLGALWLDTSKTPEVLKKYLSTGWEIVASTDVFTKSEVEGMFKALSADKINETDDAKVMTSEERDKIANLNKTYLPQTGGTITGDLNVNQFFRSNGTITTNGWISLENNGSFDPNNFGIKFSVEDNPDHVAELTMGPEGELRFCMLGSGYAFQCDQNGVIHASNGIIVGSNANVRTDGNILGETWVNGNLAGHIENRGQTYQNQCVTNSRIGGWVDIRITPDAWAEVPVGFFVTCGYYEGRVGGQLHLGGRQPQLFIADRGWFPLGTSLQ